MLLLHVTVCNCTKNIPQKRYDLETMEPNPKHNSVHPACTHMLVRRNEMLIVKSWVSLGVLFCQDSNFWTGNNKLMKIKKHLKDQFLIQSV